MTSSFGHEASEKLSSLLWTYLSWRKRWFFFYKTLSFSLSLSLFDELFFSDLKITTFLNFRSKNSHISMNFTFTTKIHKVQNCTKSASKTEPARNGLLEAVHKKISSAPFPSSPEVFQINPRTFTSGRVNCVPFPPHGGKCVKKQNRKYFLILHCRIRSDCAKYKSRCLIDALMSYEND